MVASFLSVVAMYIGLNLAITQLPCQVQISHQSKQSEHFLGLSDDIK
jgi:hypothetical protein